MLNYIWFSLIVLGIASALYIDLSDLSSNKYHNNEPVSLTLEFSSPVLKDTNAVYRGSIEIDGVDLRRLQLKSLREQIAIALQENLLFGSTVRENIRYAVPNASEEDVQAAARVACAHDFIETLPEGYDTLLGERGTRLSTGQRQRLSIARALLKDSPILILDEPTASLDAETELRLMRNLDEWGRGRVIFLIAHRLSTVRSADNIVVMQDGRIAESGTHDELSLRPEGPYRRLLEGAQSETVAAGAS